MPSIIVGTAGHIDHGKTALVRALTGVDADRLPEEKRRGITIDLGFAELDLDTVRLGFVDVPGHERFVKNMLAGAHGIDLVALVIAADEGVMPQTREHFDICRLLQVKSGLTIITKTDKVEKEFVDLVRAEAEELITGSFLEKDSIVEVSARTGAGIEELKEALREIALHVPSRSTDSIARLPVDRAFTIKGFGAVVTGTLVSGTISEGDDMELLPDGIRVRVRGLQVHGRAVGHAEAGQRTAVNLGGIEASAIERGTTLASAGRLRPTQMIDTRVEVLANAPRPLRSRMRVRLHLGTSENLARVQVLERKGEIHPGDSGFVQLRLESPVIALPEERFIIRSYSPSRTIAGGQVVDAFATRPKAKDGNTNIARLTSLMESDRAGQLALFAESAGVIGLSRADAVARTGWPDRLLDKSAREAFAAGTVVDADEAYLSRPAFETLSRSIVDTVKEFHLSEPLSRGIPRETLRERHFAHAPQGVFRVVLKHLETTGAIATDKEIVRSSEHVLTLSPTDAALKDALEMVYAKAALEPPTFEEALERAGQARGGLAHERKILQLLIESGQLIRISNELLLHREALGRLVAQLRAYAVESGTDRLIDVASFKDLAGVSRKFAIPLLEFLDRERITRRAGDKRIIL